MKTLKDIADQKGMTVNQLEDELLRFMEEFASEELLPELKPYIKTQNGIRMLHHPLVVQVPYIEQMNKRTNQFYRHKVADLAKAKQGQNYSQYIFLHERPYRLHAFMDLFMEGEIQKAPKKYWELLHDVWIDTESPYVNLDVWKMLFTQNLPFQEYFMTETDREVFKGLPDNLTIYRGYNGKGKWGISWTLDKEDAAYFANRFRKNGKIAQKVVSKDKVFGYTNQRNEQEIIFIRQSQ